MPKPIKWGLILGAAITLQTIVFAMAGWQESYSMAFVWLAIAVVINAVAVILCLRETASERGWAGQFQAGATVGVVASVIIFAATWFVTGVVFPDYYAQMAEGYREAFITMEMGQEEIERSVAQLAGTSPVRSAWEAVGGTLVVSLVTAGITGIWVRRKV